MCMCNQCSEYVYSRTLACVADITERRWLQSLPVLESEALIQCSSVAKTTSELPIPIKLLQVCKIIGQVISTREHLAIEYTTPNYNRLCQDFAANNSIPARESHFRCT